jgi:hypothetical protein
MNAVTRQLIEALHRAPYKYVLAATGGGTAAAALLLGVPGGSRTVLEVIVPYHEQAMTDFLGRRPENFCSAATSRDMARRAGERARWLVPGDAVAGIGCTASLATDRPKRGDHRFHVTVHHASRFLTHSLTLRKGARDRQGEESVLSTVLLNALAVAFGISERLEVPQLPGEVVLVEAMAETDLVVSLLAGEANAVRMDQDGRLQQDAPKPALLLPGAFNPPHRAHWQLAETAARLTGRELAFELSVTNVDKPPLTAAEVRQRLAQFQWRASVWLTQAPTFAAKAQLFPGTVFAVGADTAARLVDPRYYGDSETRLNEALAYLRAQGCRFLVAGRCGPDGRFVGLESLAIPADSRDLFTGIPEAEFRIDLSSTQLRAAARRADPVAAPAAED